MDKYCRHEEGHPKLPVSAHLVFILPADKKRDSGKQDPDAWVGQHIVGTMKGKQAACMIGKVVDMAHIGRKPVGRGKACHNVEGVAE